MCCLGNRTLGNAEPHAMLIAEDINAFSRQFPERPAESQNTKATQFFTRSARHSGIQNQSQFGDFHHFSSLSSRRRPAENRHSYQCNGWEIRPLAYPEITAPANFKPKRIRRFHFHRHAADSMRSAARLIFIVSFGEPGGTRTRDPLIKSLREPLPLFAPVSIIQ